MGIIIIDTKRLLFSVVLQKELNNYFQQGMPRALQKEWR